MVGLCAGKLEDNEVRTVLEAAVYKVRATPIDACASAAGTETPFASAVMILPMSDGSGAEGFFDLHQAKVALVRESRVRD